MSSLSVIPPAGYLFGSRDLGARQSRMDVASPNETTTLLKEKIKMATPRQKSRAMQLHSMQLSYSILGGVLASRWVKFEQLQGKGKAQLLVAEEIIKLLKSLIKLARHIQRTYQFRSISLRQANNYQLDILLYQHLMELLEQSKKTDKNHNLSLLIDGLKKLEPLRSKRATSEAVRMGTGSSNWYRLFVIRLKRIFEAVVPVLKMLNHKTLVKEYSRIITKVSNCSYGFLALLSWAFYLPRFIANTFLLAKHTIPGPWMSEQEKSIAFSVRLKQQLELRWFELVNDSIWIVGGLLTCFIISGAPAAYLTFALYGVDCVVMAVKCVLQWRKLNNKKQELDDSIKRLEQQRSQLLTQSVGNLQAVNALETKISCQIAMREQCQQQMNYQLGMASVSMATTIGLFIAVGMTLPFIANPIVMLAGASLVVAVCLAGFIARKLLEKRNPEKKVSASQVMSTTFFKQLEQDNREQFSGQFKKSISCDNISAEAKEEPLHRTGSAFF